MLRIECSTPLAGPRPDSYPTERPSSPEADAVAAVARALLLGATVRSGVYVVGRCAPGPDGWSRYVCRTRGGLAIPAEDYEEHCTSLVTRDVTVHEDWTAFGAANMFVCAVGARAAQRSLRAHCSVLSRGR